MGSPEVGGGGECRDCNDVLGFVWLYLDDETDGAVRQRIRSHLDDCAPCLRQYGLEQDVKVLVARSCGGDVAPSSLRARIRIRLQQAAIDASHLEYRAE